MTFEELHTSCLRSIPLGNGVKAGFTCDVAYPPQKCIEIAGNTGLALCRQTHSVNIAMVDEHTQYPQDTDALITQTENLAIGIRTADCVPVMLYAPDIRTIAAIHAGWRGTIGRIVPLTLQRLVTLGADPALLRASIGPSICQECYEVSTELGKQFHDTLGDTISPTRIAWHKNIPGNETRPHLDLKGINHDLLAAAGVPANNIHTVDDCTRHTTLDGTFILPSFRREADDAGRLITFIMLSPTP